MDDGLESQHCVWADTSADLSVSHWFKHFNEDDTSSQIQPHFNLSIISDEDALHHGLKVHPDGGNSDLEQTLEYIRSIIVRYLDEMGYRKVMSQ
ncbi:hypothetical protein KIN20_022384 [Parelaphostrongylus tenuis]|uniref:Uncharacterized protein n=1 Tax=Parelaphostrongylus tenuis TaxID=148309 RepID=A0AAD5MTZ3_PARTN|nr:hypothetical protein KIN20_022384 [Parelaphostrongylus tenuis]